RLVMPSWTGAARWSCATCRSRAPAGSPSVSCNSLQWPRASGPPALHWPLAQPPSQGAFLIMPASLSGRLVVAISSRALFDFEEENRLFEGADDRAYMALQLARVDAPA